jgi:two-component system sensor histidine kinase MprB
VFSAVILVSVASWVVIHRQLENQTDQNLIRETKSVTSSGRVVDPLQLASSLSGLALPFQVIYSDGVAVPPPGQAVKIPFDERDIEVARGQAPQRIRDAYSGDRHYRIVTLPDGSGVALQVAQDLSGQDHALRMLALLLLALSLGGAGLGAALGIGVARAGLRPVRALTAEAERVARTDDLAPLVLSGRGAPDDEVSRLAATFNTMLTALSRSRERQRQLVADAGHELRTPLTSLRTNLELLAREDPAAGRLLAPEDRARLMNDVVAQIAELASLVGDLTALARDETRLDAEREEVDLVDVTERAIARVRLRAPGVRVVTDLEPSLVVGQASLLERAITNVLDNAAKWSPPDGEVYVGLRRGQLIVADQGPGISDEDLPHVFERFYRARGARELPGSGLGLSIVAQTAIEHGGRVSAERTPSGGTLIRLTLPLAALPAPRVSEPTEPLVDLDRPEGKAT